MLSAFALYTTCRGAHIVLLVGDTMIQHRTHLWDSGRTSVRLLRFQTWSNNADGTRTGVWV